MFRRYFLVCFLKFDTKALKFTKEESFNLRACIVIFSSIFLFSEMYIFWIRVYVKCVNVFCVGRFYLMSKYFLSWQLHFLLLLSRFSHKTPNHTQRSLHIYDCVRMNMRKILCVRRWRKKIKSSLNQEMPEVYFWNVKKWSFYAFARD